jgi:hypothetical protein
MPFTRFATAAAALLLLVVACSSSPDPADCKLLASDYPQDCLVDSDCAPVPELDGCGGCGCSTGAINVSSLSEYMSRWDQVKQYATGSCGCPCEGSGLCCGGRCTAGCGC